MPTPTPVPSSQIVQAVQASQNIIDNAVQQGIVGVLQLLAIGLVLFMLWQILKAYIQRNNRPDNSGMNEAVKAMADGNIRSADREERLEKERQQERLEWRNEAKDRDNKFIEAVSHLGDGYNRMGDVIQRQAVLMEAYIADRKIDATTMSAMKLDLALMVSEGSLPLRNLIVENHAIKSDTEIILEHIKTIEDLLRHQADCAGIAESLEAFKKEVREQAKRSTDSQPIIPVSNVHPDTGSAGAVGEAAA